MCSTLKCKAISVTQRKGLGPLDSGGISLHSDFGQITFSLQPHFLYFRFRSNSAYPETYFKYGMKQCIVKVHYILRTQKQLSLLELKITKLEDNQIQIDHCTHFAEKDSMGQIICSIWLFPWDVCGRQYKLNLYPDLSNENSLAPYFSNIYIKGSKILKNLYIIYINILNYNIYIIYLFI